MKNFLLNEESGQGMVEYGLIIAVIAVVALVGFRALGTGAKDKAKEAADTLNSAAPTN